MSCINKSHPEFKKLLKDSKENPASLAADIGVWMDNNTSERFPTLEELGITSIRNTQEEIFKSIELTKKPIGSVITQDESVGICDGTCGILAKRLENQNMAYGHTTIPDKYANYHAIALTTIGDTRYILNQPQLEFIRREYQKAPLYERAQYFAGLSSNYVFNRHLRDFNQLVNGLDIHPEELLTGKPIEDYEFGEFPPVIENIKKEGKYYTGNLISDSTVKLRWTDKIPLDKQTDDYFHDINLKVYKEGEIVPLWAGQKLYPRFIEATKENLINEYDLTEQQAETGLLNINKAKINPPKNTKEKQIFYQRDSGKNAQKKARKIYYEEVQNKDLSQYDIGRINNKLKEISREIGDVDWNVRLSSKGNYYIAGYDNQGVTFDTYFSPYADRAFSQLSSKEDPIGKGSKYNKLELKLEKWAKQNGVSIRALESVVKEFPDRYQNNAIGISDFANSLIALADNRNADTLAEEVAHFAIEMMLDNQKGSISFLGVQDVATLLQEVENTEIYQDVLKEYEGVYTKKLDFQKEALGKLLAIQLVNQFELGMPVEVDVQESENVFWQLLKLAGEAFQAFVEAVFGVNTSSRKNLENDLIPLAKSILKGETISQSQKFKGYTKADIKYQLNEELKNTPEVPKNISVSNKQIKSKEAFLETARKRLQIRLDQFDRGRPGSEKQVEKFQKVISDLERNIALKEWDVAVAQFINSAANNEETGELQILDRILDDVLDPDVDRSLSSNSIRDAREFLEMYEGLFADFKEQSYEAGFSKAQIKEFNEMINPITILIANSQKRMNVLERLDSINSLTALNTDYNGETIDPDFNPKEIGETSTTDTSPYRLWSGNLKNAASGIIRSVHSMIFNSVAEIKRFVAYTARDILNSQTLFLTKYTQEDLIEKDSNGKLTQNIIQEHRMTDYYADIRILKDNLAKKLNVKNEEGKYDYNKIVPELLSKEDQVIYKKTWSDFYENNSIQKEKTILKHTINDEGKLVVNTKIIKFGETQYVTEDQLPGYLEKGYKVVTTKVTIPNNKYLNKDFKKLMQDPVFKSHYDLLIQTQRESVAKLPFKYQKDSLVYMNPSILKSMLDRFMANDISFLEKIKLLGQDAILIEEDDTQFGELNEYRKNAVPIFFTKKLDDISKLSFDIGRNIIMMSEMSENFRKMNMTAGKISNIESTIGNREYEKGRGKNKTLRPEKGVGTTDYETIKFLKETFVFGKEMNDWSTELEISEDNLFNKAIKKLSFGKIDMTGKHTLSWTKMISKFATYIRNGNLGFNAATALTGQLTATGDSIIQDQIGLYTTNESKNFSRLVYSKEIPTVIAEMGNIKQTSKMHLLMLDNEVLKTENLIQDSGRGRLLRKANMSNAMYLLYSTGDYALKSRITIAIYDNYRLYNGKFLTRANFYIKTAEEQGVKNNKAHQKSVSSQWSDLRKQSLWNAYEQVDGKLIIKEEFKKYVTPELLNSVKGKIEHVTHNVDGTLSKTDKGKLAKTALGAFPLMHRGFIFNLLDRKFRKGRTNFITQEEEVGEYVATANFLGEGVKNLFTGNISTTGMAAAWQNLSPARKRAVYKTALDLIYLNFASLIAAMLLAAADEDDDEENWSLQFAALLSERWVLEVSAGWSINEFVQIVKEPVVGARIIEEISSITDVMFDDDPIESGMYKGKTKLNKWGVKRLPFGMKNLYELQYPSEKINLLKKW